MNERAILQELEEIEKIVARLKNELRSSEPDAERQFARLVLTYGDSETKELRNQRETFTWAFDYAIEHRGIAQVREIYPRRIYDMRPSEDSAYKPIGDGRWWLNSHGHIDLKIKEINTLGEKLNLSLKARKE